MIKYKKLVRLAIIVHFLMYSFYSWGQNVTITGSVTGTDGEPLIGVSIKIIGTKTGVISDYKGHYTISAPTDALLEFSYLGMKTEVLEIKGNKRIDVILQDNLQQLDEVVVVGYETMRKRDLTGSIVSTSGEDLTSRMTTTVLEAMQGQTAGVQITSQSGQPGESSSVRIRGTASFSDGAVGPLYIVDGVPMDDIDMINPYDIQSLEILKDAASASIYGSRSANGVIIISTKQGAAFTPNIDVNYSHSLGNLSHYLEQTTPQIQRYFSRQRLAYATGDGNGYVPSSYTNTDIALLTDTTNFLFNANNDYQRIAFRTSQRDQIDISASGGNKEMRYALTTGILSDRGIIPETSFTRITSRLNADYNITNKIKLISRNSFLYSKKKGVDEYNYLNNILKRLPNLSLYYPDETLIGVLWGRNPLSYSQSVKFTDTYNANLYQAVEIKLMDALKFTMNLSANAGLAMDNAATPSFVINSSQTTNNAQSSAILNVSWFNENYFNYFKRFKNKHTVSAVLGFSFQERFRNLSRIYGKDSPSDEIYTLNAYIGNLDLNNTYTTTTGSSMMSFFSRATYNYMSKYILSYNMRVDGSSRFSKQNRWGYFPSISAAWRLSDEKFFKPLKNKVSDGKIRISYGVTGNQSIGDYDNIMIYDIGGVYDDLVSITPYSLASSFLKWEETVQFNVGFDALLFNRINVAFDYYNKQTKDLLTNYQLPKEVGFSSLRRNIGSLSNNGIEFLIGGDIIRQKDFTLNASFNIAQNVNKIIKLSDGKPYLLNSIWWIQEGGQVGDFYGYNSLGIFQYNESNAFTENWEQLSPVFIDGIFQNKYTLNGNEYAGNIYQKKLPNGEPFRGGDVNWENIMDKEGEPGVINDHDRKVLGNAQPDFFGGFNLSADYKNMSLMTSIVYSFGGVIYNQAQSDINSTESPTVTPSYDYIRNMWIKQGDVAKYPRPVSDYYQNNRQLNSFYLEDASYVKLKNIRLAYKLSSKVVSKLNIKSLEIYSYCNNVLTWTNYTGYDPEISTGSALSIGLDTNRYPKKREFGLGTNIRF